MKVCFVKDADDLRRIKECGIEITSCLLIALRIDAYLEIAREARDCVYIGDFECYIDEGRFKKDCTRAFRKLVTATSAKYLGGEGICSLAFDFARFFGEMLQAHEFLMEFFSNRKVSEVIMVGPEAVPAFEYAVQSSVFAAILRYECERRGIPYLAIDGHRKESSGERYHRLSVAHHLLALVGPITRTIIGVQESFYGERPLLGLVFGYDGRRYKGFLNRFASSVGQRVVVLTSARPLWQLHYNISTFSRGNEDGKTRVSDFVKRKRWKLLFGETGLAEEYPSLFGNDHLDFQWQWFFSQLLEHVSNFGDSAMLLRSAFEMNEVFTTTPFRRYSYILNKLKNDGCLIVYVSHSGWLDAPYVLGDLPDQYVVWGRGQREFLLSESVPAERITIVGNPAVVTRRYPCDYAARARICRELAITAKKIITFVGYPFNGIGGVFADYGRIQLARYREFLECLLSIDLSGLDAVLIIKSHPQIDFHSLYDRIQSPFVYHFRNVDLEKLGPISDVVIASGGPSTALFEMAKYSVPLVYYRTGENVVIRELIDRVATVVENQKEFLSCIAKILSDEAYRRRLGEKARMGLDYFAY